MNASITIIHATQCRNSIILPIQTKVTVWLSGLKLSLISSSEQQWTRKSYLPQPTSTLHQLTGLLTGWAHFTSSQQGPFILWSNRNCSRALVFVPNTWLNVSPCRSDGSTAWFAYGNIKSLEELHDWLFDAYTIDNRTKRCNTTKMKACRWT